jgi:hypothetical protein
MVKSPVSTVKAYLLNTLLALTALLIGANGDPLP